MIARTARPHLHDLPRLRHDPVRAGDRASVFGEQPVHALTEAYPDEDFSAAVAKAASSPASERTSSCASSASSPARRRSRASIPRTTRWRGSARPFLLTVENLIHELVRATIPKATPPQLGSRAARRRRGQRSTTRHRASSARSCAGSWRERHGTTASRSRATRPRACTAATSAAGSSFASARRASPAA